MNMHQITAFMKAQFDVCIPFSLFHACYHAEWNQEPSPTMFAGLSCLCNFFWIHVFNHLSLWYCNHPATIICTENSFWHQSTSCPFIEAFKIAFQSYISTGMQEKLKMALLDLCNIKANKKIFHQEFTQKVLDHRLCILFFTFFSLMLILFCDAVHPEDMKSEPGSFNVN